MKEKINLTASQQIPYYTYNRYEMDEKYNYEWKTVKNELKWDKFSCINTTWDTIDRYKFIKTYDAVTQETSTLHWDKRVGANPNFAWCLNSAYKTYNDDFGISSTFNCQLQTSTATRAQNYIFILQPNQIYSILEEVLKVEGTGPSRSQGEVFDPSRNCGYIQIPYTNTLNLLNNIRNRYSIPQISDLLSNYNYSTFQEKTTTEDTSYWGYYYPERESMATDKYFNGLYLWDMGYRYVMYASAEIVPYTTTPQFYVGALFALTRNTYIEQSDEGVYQYSLHNLCPIAFEFREDDSRQINWDRNVWPQLSNDYMWKITDTPINNNTYYTSGIPKQIINEYFDRSKNIEGFYTLGFNNYTFNKLITREINYGPNQGDLIETIGGTSLTAYPVNGKSGDYWYVGNRNYFHYIWDQYDYSPYSQITYTNDRNRTVRLCDRSYSDQNGYYVVMDGSDDNHVDQYTTNKGHRFFIVHPGVTSSSTLNSDQYLPEIAKTKNGVDMETSYRFAKYPIGRYSNDQQFPTNFEFTLDDGTNNFSDPITAAMLKADPYDTFGDDDPEIVGDYIGAFHNESLYDLEEGIVSNRLGYQVLTRNRIYRLASYYEQGYRFIAVEHDNFHRPFYKNTSEYYALTPRSFILEFGDTNSSDTYRHYHLFGAFKVGSSTDTFLIKYNESSISRYINNCNIKCFEKLHDGLGIYNSFPADTNNTNQDMSGYPLINNTNLYCAAPFGSIYTYYVDNYYYSSTEVEKYTDITKVDDPNYSGRYFFTYWTSRKHEYESGRAAGQLIQIVGSNDQNAYPNGNYHTDNLWYQNRVVNTYYDSNFINNFVVLGGATVFGKKCALARTAYPDDGIQDGYAYKYIGSQFGYFPISYDNYITVKTYDINEYPNDNRRFGYYYDNMIPHYSTDIEIDSHMLLNGVSYQTSMDSSSSLGFLTFGGLSCAEISFTFKYADFIAPYIDGSNMTYSIYYNNQWNKIGVFKVEELTYVRDNVYSVNGRDYVRVVLDDSTQLNTNSTYGLNHRNIVLNYFDIYCNGHIIKETDLFEGYNYWLNTLKTYLGENKTYSLKEYIKAWLEFEGYIMYADSDGKLCVRRPVNPGASAHVYDNTEYTIYSKKTNVDYLIHEFNLLKGGELIVSYSDGIAVTNDNQTYSLDNIISNQTILTEGEATESHSYALWNYIVSNVTYLPSEIQFLNWSPACYIGNIIKVKDRTDTVKNMLIGQIAWDNSGVTLSCTN